MSALAFDWNAASKSERCEQFRALDARFGTDPLSPLHHDGRCPIHNNPDECDAPANGWRPYIFGEGEPA